MEASASEERAKKGASSEQYNVKVTPFAACGMEQQGSSSKLRQSTLKLKESGSARDTVTSIAGIDCQR